MFRFPSMTYSDSIAYEFDSDWRSRDPHHTALARWAYEYQTYGDGMTQHAPEYHVPIEHMTDFLRSLAVHVASNPEDLAELAKEWPNFDHEKQIKFLMDVKHVPYDKEIKSTWRDRYFNYQDMKISSADGKRHDKRWEKIWDGMDGSPDVIMSQIMQHEYVRNTISKYALMMQVKKAFKDKEAWFDEKGQLKQFGIDWDEHLAKKETGSYWRAESRLNSAFSVVDSLVKSHCERSWAERQIEGWESDPLVALVETTDESETVAV